MNAVYEIEINIDQDNTNILYDDTQFIKCYLGKFNKLKN